MFILALTFNPKKFIIFFCYNFKFLKYFIFQYIISFSRLRQIWNKVKKKIKNIFAVMSNKGIICYQRFDLLFLSWLETYLFQVDVKSSKYFRKKCWKKIFNIPGLTLKKGGGRTHFTGTTPDKICSIFVTLIKSTILSGGVNMSNYRVS